MSSQVDSRNQSAGKRARTDGRLPRRLLVLCHIGYLSCVWVGFPLPGGQKKTCVSQAAGVRMTGFAPAARMSTSPSAPLATCATATSPGQRITRPCKSLCRLRPTTPRQGVTWAQGHLHRCTLVGVLPRMGPPCLMDLQCRRAMAFLSSLGVRRIHMDMVVAYRWGAPMGRCKWPGHLHILVDL